MNTTSITFFAFSIIFIILYFVLSKDNNSAGRGRLTALITGIVVLVLAAYNSFNLNQHLDYIVNLRQNQFNEYAKHTNLFNYDTLRIGDHPIKGYNPSKSIVHNTNYENLNVARNEATKYYMKYAKNR